MRKAVGVTAATATLAAMLTASSPPSFESFPHSKGIKAQPNHLPQDLLPHHTKALGGLANRNTVSPPPTPSPVAPSSSLPPEIIASPLPETPQIVKQRQQAADFLLTNVIPAVAKDPRLKKINPVSLNPKEPFIPPQGMIVQYSPSCAVQLLVTKTDSIKPKRKPYNVSIATFGDPTYISTEKLFYGRSAQIHYMHAESTQEEGEDFDPGETVQLQEFLNTAVGQACNEWQKLDQAIDSQASPSVTPTPTPTSTS
jgi:hypothetical protein